MIKKVARGAVDFSPSGILYFMALSNLFSSFVSPWHGFDRKIQFQALVSDRPAVFFNVG